VLAVERPTWQRQLAVPAAVLVAYLVRPKCGVLYPAFVLAVAAVSRRRVRELWVTGVVTGLVLAGAGAGRVELRAASDHQVESRHAELSEDQLR
jgi:hypothetical protein